MKPKIEIWWMRLQLIFVWILIIVLSSLFWIMAVRIFLYPFFGSTAPASGPRMDIHLPYLQYHDTAS